MRKFLIILNLLLAVSTRLFAEETLTQTDGTKVTGDIVKSDDVAVMLHTGDTYATVPWGQLSQDSLKHLAENPKLTAYAAPFIDPTAADMPQAPKVAVHPVTRLKSPDQMHPSILGGMFGSSLGLFILLVVYGANLYAAYEIALVRGRPVPLVMGVSVVLPIVGPIIFLSQQVKTVSLDEQLQPEAVPGAEAPVPGGVTSAPGAEDVQVVPAWQASPEEKKPEPQVFSRGKFTFNKRFIETKFAGFVGEPKGEAKTNSMTIKTSKDMIVVECIKQVAATEAILETPNGQLTLAFGDIQEIILTPKPA